MFILIWLIFVSLAIQFSNGGGLNKEFAAIFQHIKSYSTAEQQAEAAAGVIQRTIPDHAHLFEVTINLQLKPNTFQLLKNESTDIVLIEASSGVSACKAFHHYLTYYCNSHVSWDGMKIRIPAELPDVNVTQTSPSRFIYYQNVCTWSYSFVWWQWSDWRKHIDWIAMQGISLTLAPVQELIWERVYTELGLMKDEIDDHFAGPAFFAWQRMGNLRGWGGPLPSYFKRYSSVLQKRVIGTLRDLGIAVALPAFAGHVPVAFKRIYPNASLTPAERWNRFPDAFSSPLFIDPVDPLFKQIGSLFLKKIIQEYGGTNHIYFSDPFNEMQPRKATPQYLSDASNGIYDTMKSVDSKAVWLLQAWMFVKNPFWSDNLLKAFLTAVPVGRMLVLDLQSELYPQHTRTLSFYGQPFIWCMLHNFGGTLGMHGSLDVLNEEIVKTRKSKNSSMIGVGITPEGINQNYVMYEFALDRGWLQDSVNVTKWLDHYVFVRYGFENVGIKASWRLLQQTVYNYKGIKKISGKYAVCRRPSINLKPYTWYNLTLMDDVLRDFLCVSENEIENNELYIHDLVDITRQMLQNKIDILYKKLIAAYEHQNVTLLQEYASQFEEILTDLDRILSTHKNFLLGSWLDSSKALATNAVEEQVYEFNARNQITIWGPSGQIVDYANKQWAGIVIDYCLPRWKLFFDELIETLIKKKRKFNDNKCKQKIFKEIEEPFGVSNKIYETKPHGDPVEIARRIYAKWKKTLIL